jgi:methyltransferase of ATP-grasp peptide maturase system
MTLTRADKAAGYRADLVGQMRGSGVLDDPAWYHAFATVPREAFLRGGVLVQAEGPHGTWWQSLAPHDPGFLRQVYRDVPLATQIDGRLTPGDVPPGSGVTGAATCSSTQPSLMALMLDHLQVEDGMTVLEIGTGVGYNATILASRLGTGQVTSIEYDPALADTARTALADRGGGLPLVLTGDGALGHPDRAPYDRLIATCGFPAIPRPWLVQVRPGGLIVTNLYRPLGTGLLAVLRVQPDRTAIGRVAPDSGGFMPTRAITTIDPADRHRDVWRALATAPTRPSPLPFTALDDPGFRFHAALSVPAADLEVIGKDPGDSERWLFTSDGSAARATPAGTGTSVTEHGPTPLWTALEHAHDTYQQLGQPDRGTYRITITRQDQYVWHPGQTSTGM